MTSRITRRRLITAGTVAAAAPLLSGCDQISDAPQFRWFLDLGQAASQHVQRLLLARGMGFSTLHIEPEQLLIAGDDPGLGNRGVAGNSHARKIHPGGGEQCALAFDGFLFVVAIFATKTMCERFLRWLQQRNV